MDIRRAFAYEIAEQIGAKVLKDSCPRCRFPYLEKPEQGFPFCWTCVTDTKNAKEGQRLLAGLRIAVEGIVIVDNSGEPL